MRRLPPCATRADTRVPYTTLFRSGRGRPAGAGARGDEDAAHRERAVRRHGHRDRRQARRAGRRRRGTRRSGGAGVNTFTESEERQELRKAVAKRSEEHTSELQSLMRISYAVFCLKKKKKYNT